MTLIDAIAAAGLTARGRNSYSPCPVCGSERRGRHDSRGPIAIYGNGENWKCLAGGCGVGGSALALAAAVRFGEIPGHGDPRWRELYDGDGKRKEVRAQQREPVYPPVEEVAALWGACLPAQEPAGDVRVSEWLMDRELPETPLVRSMPPGTARFEWIPDAAWSTHPVVVCEGEPDWLTWATKGGGWATFGLVAGSWTAAIAARIPDGCKVALRLHADAAGKQYADTVRRTLEGRCEILRPASNPDTGYYERAAGEVEAALMKHAVPWMRASCDRGQIVNFLHKAATDG